MSKAKPKTKAERAFLAEFARAIALANGHSHPDEYADRVVGFYTGELEPETEDAPPAGGEG